MSAGSILQKVIDYEFNIVQQKVISDYPSSRPISNARRFTQWNLMDTIKKIPQHYEYNLLWVGNDRLTHIICFFYCVVLGSLQSSDKLDEAFLKVKFYLYQLSEEFLSIDEQKIFVENICLIQYSKSLTQFLKKNQTFQDVLTKIFIRYHKKHSCFQINQDFQPFQELKLFSSMFQFTQFQKVDEKICKINIKNSFFYLVEELDCFFILEEKNMSPIKKMLSESSEELIYQTYRKRSSKKRKLNSPQNDSAGGISSSPKMLQDYSTPKFYIKSSKQQKMSHYRPSNEIKVDAWRDSSEQSSGKKGFFDLTKIEDKSMFPHFLTLNSPQTEKASSPQTRQKLINLPEQNGQNPRARSKGDQNKSFHNIIKNQGNFLKQNVQKQQYHNPEAPLNKFQHRRDKTIVQSLGVNQMKEFRRSIPLMQENRQPKQKRSVPKFILEKQERKSKKASPPHRDLTSPLSPTQQIKNNVIRPKISSKVYVNSNTLASPSQYLFPYHLK